MAAPVTYFGIRHHGPGSAAALVAGLDELHPVCVLIEGPADATELLPMLADPAMIPPVALLAYPPDDPAKTAFWPFAEFSPEYQATLWAVHNGAHVEFIDLPSSAQFEYMKRSDTTEHDSNDGSDAPRDAENSTSEKDSQDAAVDPASSKEVAIAKRRHTDPIAELALAAGYEDGESWWSDLVEQNPEPGPIFEAIAKAMAEVRADELGTPEEQEARREAYMRQAIASHAGKTEGPIAIVCGAWHVPALTAKHTKTADKAAIGTLPRKKSQLTWAPWTSPRLAMAIGYGAGVAAPGWNKHLWSTRKRSDSVSVWLTRIAQILRDRGHLASTASLIEAQRLALALAALRDRPQPGFEELREACIACLFDGESLLWKIIEDELLLGNEVGEIPPNVPLAPLIEDLQTQAKAARLKMEALERELSLDLRSESGLFRSTLLHRLTILEVGWGRLTDAGRSRGTFREKWILAYDPAYTVELVTKLVYGPTIEQAASTLISERFTKATTLSELATGIRDALTAALPAAVDYGLELLANRAALSSDCEDILSTLPPLSEVLRYGEARTTDLGSLDILVEHLIAEAGINMMYAARSLDEEGAEHLSNLITRADAGIQLIEPEKDIEETWRRGLWAVLNDSQAAPRVAGCVASLLYEGGFMDASEAVTLLNIRLSPGSLVADAANFLEGFFGTAARRLIYDDGLRNAVDTWLKALDEEDFIAYLPLMRRVLGTLDAMERKRLMAALAGKRAALPSGLALAPDAEAIWARHLAVLKELLNPSTLMAQTETGGENG